MSFCDEWRTTTGVDVEPVYTSTVSSLVATASLLQWGCQARNLTGLVDQSFVCENVAIVLTLDNTWKINQL
jgi:hypothetical protein